MTGSKANLLTREEVLSLVKDPSAQGDFEWDGVDEDERPPTREEMQAGIETARRRRGRSAGPTKTQISLRIDNDTLAAFRAMGAGWQSRMNQALKEWIEGHRKP